MTRKFSALGLRSRKTPRPPLLFSGLITVPVFWRLAKSKRV
jgi:hypothetical protein